VRAFFRSPFTTDSLAHGCGQKAYLPSRIEFAQPEVTMIKRILIPTDGSKLSEESAKYGVLLAKATKADITALHVSSKFHTSSDVMDLVSATSDQYSIESNKEATKYLARVKKIADDAGVTCDVVHVGSDYPFKEIISAAEMRTCDLIVMASHGRLGAVGMLLGSQTQKVLTHSKIPVLVYR